MVSKPPSKSTYFYDYTFIGPKVRLLVNSGDNSESSKYTEFENTMTIDKKEKEVDNKYINDEFPNILSNSYQSIDSQDQEEPQKPYIV